MSETYIDFMIAPYAIVRVLLMLDNAEIKNFSITQEDYDLHIRIPKSHLEEIESRPFRKPANLVSSAE